MPFDLKRARDVRERYKINLSYAREKLLVSLRSYVRVQHFQCADMLSLPGQSVASVPIAPRRLAPGFVPRSCRPQSRQLLAVCNSSPPRSALPFDNNDPSTSRKQSDSTSRTNLQQVHTATGFPIPLPRYVRTARPKASEVRQQILRQWASRQARQEMLTAQREKDAAARRSYRRERQNDDEKRLLQPVFRASPYAAEALREQRAAKTASILFLDEGNYCRSVLAEAVFKEIVWSSALEPFVRVESASIGPTDGPALHDARVMWAAQKAGLTLASRSLHPFNETEDIVNYDLVLTMDHFDHDEVYREVAVFDTMNPGGGYSTRVRQLGSFAAGAPKAGMFWEDISDPLYGNSGDAQERAALLAAVHQLRLSCRGLVHQLHQLHARSVRDGKTLPHAIAGFLGQINLPQLPDKLAKTSKPFASGRARRPVWRKNDSEQPGDFYTIRTVRGKRQVIKKRTVGWGYWSDIRNVRQELQRWMQAHPTKDPKKLPSQIQMRQTGDNSLAFAIHKHGGYPEVFPEHKAAAQELDKVAQRRPRRHWQDFETLRQELQPFLCPVTDPLNSPHTHSTTDTQPAAEQSLSHHQHEAGRQQGRAKLTGTLPATPSGNGQAVLQADRLSTPENGSKLGQATQQSRAQSNGHTNGQGSWQADGQVVQKAHQQAFQLGHAQRGKQADNGYSVAVMSRQGRSQAVQGCNGHTNGQSAQQSNSRSNGQTTAPSNGQHNGQVSLQGNGQAHGQADGPGNGQRNGHKNGQANRQVQLRMCTQKELMRSGRMDLLNAVRLWGGLTAVANRMNVLPNTRHNRSQDDLKRELQELIAEQGWPEGHMPKHTQLQAAGRHDLCAAIIRMGGIRTVAAQFGFDKGPKETRGRTKKVKKTADRAPKLRRMKAGNAASREQRGSSLVQARSNGAAAGMASNQSSAADFSFRRYRPGMTRRVVGESQAAAAEAAAEEQRDQAAVKELELVA